MLAYLFAVRTSWVGMLLVIAAVFAVWFVVRVVIDFVTWFREEIIDDFRETRQKRKRP
jgi:uncharacterized membrane protein